MNSDKKGIYKITNLENGRIYIGKTTTSFIQRKNEHIADLITNSHKNKYLQQDWRWYGERAFDFSVIEELENNTDIDIKELEYITKYNESIGRKLYNIAGITRDFPVYVDQGISSAINQFSEFMKSVDIIDDGHIAEMYLAGLSRTAIYKILGGNKQRMLKRIKAVIDDLKAVELNGE